jgi:hypothetical protein
MTAVIFFICIKQKQCQLFVSAIYMEMFIYQNTFKIERNLMTRVRDFFFFFFFFTKHEPWLLDLEICHLMFTTSK